MLETNVLRTVADGNIGSIMAGVPAWTGGLIHREHYGLERFSARCAELASQYGDRFDAPAIVGEKSRRGNLRLNDIARLRYPDRSRAALS